MTTAGVLRAVNHRLTSTPIEDLPPITGFLATSIYNCSEILKEAGTKKSDSSIQVHKLKTRISSLLQDRSQEGRFAGVVLAKAAVEAGGSGFLNDCGAWVRNILSCLNKPDPAELKKLYLVTLARIFILTTNHATLIREVTTPILPAFISTCLALVKPVATLPTRGNVRVLNPLLPPTLQCWIHLMQRFPSTFRPHLPIIRSICLSLIGDVNCPEATKSMASEVVARLHFCAPKNAVGTEWSQLCEKVIDAAHEVADHILRAVVEDWSLSSTRNSTLVGKSKTASELHGPSNDILGIGPWVGVPPGCSRLVSLINLLRNILTNSHAQAVSIPVVTILDLTGRISAVTLPSTKFSLRTNPEITRNEREDLYLNLPQIHTATLNLLQTFSEIFQQTLWPISTTIGSQVWNVFEAEQAHEEIRTATYRVILSFLEHRLFHPSKFERASFQQLIQVCCADLKAESNVNPTVTKRNLDETTLSVSNLVEEKQHKSNHRVHHSQLFRAAWALLPAILAHGPLDQLPSSHRALLDSTAIMITHREAMLASVLNPPKHRNANQTSSKAAPSILPFLAACDVQDLSTEALLRPRMPRIGGFEDDQHANGLDENEDEKEATLAEAPDAILEDTPMHDPEIASSQRPQSSPGIQAPVPADTDPTTTLSSKRSFASIAQPSTDTQLSNTSTSPPTATVESQAKRARITDEVGTDLEKGSSEHAHTPRPVPNTLFEHSPGPSMIATNAGKENKELLVEDGATILATKPISNDGSTGAVAGSSNVAGRTVGNGDVNDDDDESDFEMPTIDTTLSTSDEEEDE